MIAFIGGTVCRPRLLARVQRFLLLWSDQPIDFLPGLLPDFLDLFLLLPRRERRILAHSLDLRMSVAFNRVMLFHYRLADASLPPAGLLPGPAARRS
jgi:hypothetical protein